MRQLRPLAALTLLLGVLACNDSDPASSDSSALAGLAATRAADFRGSVVATDARSGRFLLQYRDATVNSGRIWFALRRDTRLLHESGAHATATDVRAGQTVRVWTSQPILESDPGQGSADIVVIER